MDPTGFDVIVIFVIFDVIVNIFIYNKLVYFA